jgi:hypothetical protein
LHLWQSQNGKPKVRKSNEKQKNQKTKYTNPAGVFEKLGSCRRSSAWADNSSGVGIRG